MSGKFLHRIFRYLILLWCLQSAAQEYAVVWYNCENLFDIKDDSLKNDETFTPSGSHHWTPDKYWKKINHIGKVVLTTSGWNELALVGLCEVENDKTLNDLVYNSPLQGLKLHYLHHESKDSRGIDVALLYQPNIFEVLDTVFIPLKSNENPEFVSRDILYCKGIWAQTDTVHVFVNHWPSKYGGAVKTEEYRELAAQTLSAFIDSVTDSHSKVIIMGDFNETLEEPALQHLTSDFLHPQYTSDFNKGSHKYNGVWSQIDYFVLSSPLLNATENLKVKNWEIADLDFLLVPDESYNGVKPFRTYNGMRYLGGYSDHLPLVLNLSIKK